MSFLLDIKIDQLKFLVNVSPDKLSFFCIEFKFIKNDSWWDLNFLDVQCDSWLVTSFIEFFAPNHELFQIESIDQAIFSCSIPINDMVDGSSEWICDYILTWGINQLKKILPVFSKQCPERHLLFAVFLQGILGISCWPCMERASVISTFISNLLWLIGKPLEQMVEVVYTTTSLEGRHLRWPKTKWWWFVLRKMLM